MKLKIKGAKYLVYPMILYWHCQDFTLIFLFWKGPE